MHRWIPGYKGRRQVTAAILYLALALASTWPLVGSCRSCLPLGTEPAATVPLFNVWTVWWNADRAVAGYQGYWDAPIFHPVSSGLRLFRADAAVGSRRPDHLDHRKSYPGIQLLTSRRLSAQRMDHFSFITLYALPLAGVSERWCDDGVIASDSLLVGGSGISPAFRCHRVAFGPVPLWPSAYRDGCFGAGNGAGMHLPDLCLLRSDAVCFVGKFVAFGWCGAVQGSVECGRFCFQGCSLVGCSVCRSFGDSTRRLEKRRFTGPRHI